MKFPIHLIVGDNNTVTRGITVLFEKEDGTAGYQTIQFTEEEFKKIKFISEGPSEIEFDSERTPFYNPKVKEIRIRREHFND